MYSYSERFKIAQEREPFLISWIENNTPLQITPIEDPKEAAWLDRVYHIDQVCLNKTTGQSVGLSLRTINIESHIHKSQGYGIHLRTKDLKSGNLREFFKNPSKFNSKNLKEKTGVDYILVAQGFFKHSSSSSEPPELIGVIITEAQQLMEIVSQGNYLEYTMGKHTSHPAVFTFVPFFEILPKLPVVKFQLKDLRSEICIKSYNVVKWKADV